MKDPAFLFYPNDYLGGTMGMSFEEKGAYIELLMLQFNRGHMTSHMIGQCVGQLWDKIQDKFLVDTDGLYYNKRLDEEKNKRKLFTNSRKNNLKGNNQYTHINGHMTNHMENVNVNVNNSLISLGGLGENEKRELVFSVMDYYNFNEIQHPDKLSKLSIFVNVIYLSGNIELFKTQFEAYKLFKETSKEIRHSFTSFLGSIENKFIDGGWNARNWSCEMPRINGEKNGSKIKQAEDAFAKC